MARPFLQPAICMPRHLATAAIMRPRSKKPGGVSRPGGWRSFGEYPFLEDSRYTSQEGRGRICILRLLRRAYAHSISTSFQKPIQ